jgi:hypothetical protein
MGDAPKVQQPKSISEFRTRADGRRRTVRSIGNQLRATYSDFLKEPLPPRIADLLRRLDSRR